jgi:iron complex transport system ATP-binding protein
MSLCCLNISFCYDARKILDSISFEVKRGVLCVILGPNGSGKTTLLHCLNGILSPDKGRVIVDGINILKLSQLEKARYVSMMPQEHTEIFPFNVLDLVVMGRTPFLKMYQTPQADDYRQALDVLTALNAAHLARRNFNQLSGGEKQITLLARALVQNAETLLLDEPTNHLDFKNQYLLLNHVKNICRKQGARVVATVHNPNLAIIFADQVIMLKRGRVLAQGPTLEVMTEENVSSLYETETRQMDFNGYRFFLPLFIEQFRMRT